MAYFIGTSLHNADYADLWLGSVGTKANQTTQVIDLIKKEYQKIAAKGVTQKELDAAKSYITGSFALNLDKNEKLAAYLVMMQLEDLGMDYLEKRNSYVNAVTLEQVNALAKALVSAEKLVFITAGK
jgi:zinc protease